MPTRTIALKATESSADIARSSSNRVPLEALQMLTQSVSKCSNQEYIQPLPFKDDEQKKSPLALLAATCSSIGKTEPSKETVESEGDNTSRARKISDDETRSSFKPYKHNTAGEKIDEMSAEKAGFRAPSKENNTTSISPVTSNKEETRAKSSSALQYPASDEGHCGSHTSSQSRVCGMFLDPSQQSYGVHSLHKECGAGCVHPASIMPYKGTIQPYPVAQDAVSSSLKTHGLASSMPLNFPTSFPQCGCGFCTPHGADAGPALNNIGAGRHQFQLHNPASTPYMDYLQRTVCRDVNCTNCKPQYSPYAFPNAIPQCGPHCTQCDGVKTEQSPQSPFSCFGYPHSMALYKPGATADEASPYVCNWVAGSKHCGKSFSTSEDLFQHLRTHTQGAGTQVSSSPYAAQATCNVHGCPCKLRTSPLQSSLHSARYRPYYYKPPVFPPAPTGCYSPYQMHGYDAHRLFK